MIAKTIHCSYCGRVIVTLGVTIETDAHIQELKVLAVCDKCSKPNSVQYSQHDLKDRHYVYNTMNTTSTNAPYTDWKDTWVNTGVQIQCSSCGGSLQDGKCPICEALK